MILTPESVDKYFQDRPYYWTDGTHFRSRLSRRQSKGWRYIGRFHNAKEARAQYELDKAQFPSLYKEAKQ